MPDSLLTIISRRRTWVTGMLVFVVVFAQPAWVYGLAAPAFSFSTDAVGPVGRSFSPGAVHVSALPPWFARSGVASVAPDLAFAAPLPDWFGRSVRPRPFLQLAQPSLSKSASNPTPIPGEVYTYTLVYTIPAGITVTNLSLVDILPSSRPRLRVFGVNGNATGPTAVGSAPPVAPVIPTVSNFDRQIDWALQDVVNDSAGPYVYRITYQAQVGTSNVSSQHGDVGVNSADLNWDGGTAHAEAPVTIVAPNPAVTRKARTADGQNATSTTGFTVVLGDLRAGEVITFTVQITNVNDSFVGPAYDVDLTDNVPDWVTFGGLVSGPAPSSQSASQLVWSFTTIAALDEMTPGETFGPVVYTATVNNGVAPGRSDTEATRMDYLYLPGGDGDDVQASIRFQTPDVEVVKTVEDELLPPLRVVAGEIVTYTVVYTFPWGTTVYTPTYLYDEMDDGLRFMGVVNQPAEVVSLDVDMSGENDTLLRWYLAAPLTFATDVRHTYVFTARVSPTFFLGSDAGDTVPKGGGSILNPGNLNNRARVYWLPEPGGFRDGSSWSEDVEVQMIRPEIVPSKVAPALPGNEFPGGGRPVRFELTVQNSSDSNSDVAYNVVVTDTLPEGWTHSASDPPGTVGSFGGRTIVTWTAISLPVGSYLPGPSVVPTRYVVTATPPLNVVVGKRYTNTVAVGYGNVQGYQYVNQSDLAMQVVFTVSKAVSPTGQLFVGDALTYSLTAVVPPRAIVYWPRHVDTMPPGVHYAGSYQISGGTLDSGPVTGTAGNQETLTWGWNSLDNTASDSPLTVTLSFVARATGLISGGARVWTDYGDSATLDNRSTLAWNTEDVNGVYPVSEDVDLVGANQIVQPYLVERNPVKTLVGGGPSVVSGDRLTYSLVVYNTGLAPAYDVVISDTLPAGLAFDAYQSRVYPYSGGSFVPAASVAPSLGQQDTVGWSFDVVAAGDGSSGDPDTRLVVTYTVQVIDEVGSGATLVNNAWISDYSSQPGANAFERHYAYVAGAGDQAAAVLVPEAQIAKTANVTEMALGGIVVFTVTVPDPALGATLYNVAVTDTMPGPIPGPLHVLDAQAPGATLTVTSDTVLAQYGSIVPGSPATIIITARVPVTAIGGLASNVAQVVWEDAPSGGGGHTATDSAGVTIIAPDVRVTKDAPSAAPPGYPLVYTIQYENIGTATARDARLTDTLPMSVTYVQSRTSRPVTPVVGFPNPLAWELGDLDRGVSGTIWLTTTVWQTAPLDGAMVNSVAIHTPSPGDNPLNNQDTITTFVGGSFLLLFKSAAPDPVQAGDMLNYTLIVTNDGSLPTQDLVVTDRLPADVTFVSATGGVAPVGGLLTWTPAQIGAGNRAEITFAVRVDSPLVSGTKIVNRWYGADASNAPPIALPLPVTVTVHSQPVLEIAKTAAATVDPGQDLLYTIRYRNTGNAVAHNVRITESYAADVSYTVAVPLPSLGDNVWVLGPLTPTVSDHVIVVTTRVATSTTDGTILTNTVTIDSDETEPQSDVAVTRVGDYVIYMPIIMKNYSPPPVVKVNLVVQSIQVKPAAPFANQATRITVTLYNSGTNAVTGDFWVDLYIDPSITPTGGVVWSDIAEYGKAWFIHDDVPGGGTLVIHTDQPDDADDPGAIYSNWPGRFVSAGVHVLYAQVDAYGSATGLIPEDDETDNVYGPLSVTVAPSSTLAAPSPPIQWQERR